MRNFIVALVVIGLLVSACGGEYIPEPGYSTNPSGETVRSGVELEIVPPPELDLDMAFIQEMIDERTPDPLDNVYINWYQSVSDEDAEITVLPMGVTLMAKSAEAPPLYLIVGALFVGTETYLLINSPEFKAWLNTPGNFVSPVPTHYDVYGVGGVKDLVPFMIYPQKWTLPNGPAPVELLANQLDAALPVGASNVEVWAAVQAHYAGLTPAHQLGVPDITAEAFPEIGLRAPTPVGALLPPFEEGGGGEGHAAQTRKTLITLAIAYNVLRFYGSEVYYAPTSGKLLVIARDPVAGVVAGIFHGTTNLDTGQFTLDTLVTVIFQYHNSKAGLVNVDQVRRSGCHTWQLYAPPPVYNSVYEPISAGGTGTCQINGNSP